MYTPFYTHSIPSERRGELAAIAVIFVKVKSTRVHLWDKPALSGWLFEFSNC